MLQGYIHPFLQAMNICSIIHEMQDVDLKIYVHACLPLSQLTIEHECEQSMQIQGLANTLAAAKLHVQAHPASV